MKIKILIGLMVLLISLTGSMTRAQEVQITKVFKKSVKALDRGNTTQLKGLKEIKKFSIQDKHLEEAIITESFTVRFKLSEVPVENIKVLFSYQPEEGNVQTLSLDLSEVTRKYQKVVFKREESDYIRHGIVKSWRIQIFQNDQVVGEKQSKLWSA